MGGMVFALVSPPDRRDRRHLQDFLETLLDVYADPRV
jgi:hypothetical protein